MLNSRGYTSVLLGLTLLTTAFYPALQPSAFAADLGPSAAVDQLSCWLLYFQEGSYGALLLVVTGVGAVVSCALGGYRTAINCLIVALSSWMIRPVAELMFDYTLDCKAIGAPVSPSDGAGENLSGSF